MLFLLTQATKESSNSIYFLLQNEYLGDS
jgi:hypothetical protein